MLIRGEIILIPSVAGQEVFKVTLWLQEGYLVTTEMHTGTLEDCRQWIKEKCKC